MKKPKYTWTEDIRWVGVDAQIVGEALDEIKDKHDGVLTAAAVVDASRPKSAPLHPCFEWDNTKAAEKYRESQARTIIRSIRVVDAAPGTPQEPVKVYAHVDDPVKGQGYQPLATIMSDEELRQQVISKTIDSLAKLRAKLAGLLGLEDICKAIQELEDRLVDRVMSERKKERRRASVTSIESGRVNIQRVS